MLSRGWQGARDGSSAVQDDCSWGGRMTASRSRAQGRLRDARASLRRLALMVVASAALGLALAGSAYGAPSMSFIPSFSEGTHLGEGTIVTGTFGFTGSEYHGMPLPLIELTMRLPKSAVLSNAGFPTCPRATLEPSGPGPSACPTGSGAGPTGSFTTFVAFGGEYIEEHGVVETYFSPEGGVWLLLAGHSPVWIEVLVAGHYLAAAPPLGPAVRFEVPLIETVPGAPLASTTALTIPLGATRESEGKVSASVTAPA